MMILFAAASMACSSGSNEVEVTTAEEETSSSTSEAVTATADFVFGADISWTTEYEARGWHFYTASGVQTECTALMQSLGMTAVRLRVWVDPSDGYCNKEDLLEKALRAKELGMDIMIDFHYSDSWADPEKQNIPSAWSSDTYAQMKEHVAAHTVEVLQLLSAHSVSPKWVQVGNETSNGFLWEMGKADTNPKQYAGLFQAGYEAVKSVFSDAIVIVHLDNGFNYDLYEWNLDLLRSNGAQWDMIGMSLYPYWAMSYHGYTSADKVITDCVSTIKKVYLRYGTDVMITETGVQCSDGNGNVGSAAVLAESKRQMELIISQCRDNTDGICRGVFYWEPECRPSHYALGAFTNDGKPTAIMEAFQ